VTGSRLAWDGDVLEVRARRAGLRTTVTLLRDGAPAGERTGLLRVLLPLPDAPEPAPAVLVLTPAPGVVARTALLLPRPPGDADEAGGDGGDLPDPARRVLDLATAERRPFDPAPGTFAARLRDVEEHHPRLWALRHVALAAGKVAAAVLGLAVLLQALVRPLLEWLAGLLPRVELPSIPWPDLDLPSIPWPDVDLPDVSLPGWLQAVLGTAEYWGPVLVAVAVAAHEVRRKRRGPHARTDDGTGGGSPGARR
jgi:hypothetical protein